MNRTSIACASVLSLALLGAAALLAAGPLSPPAGPVTSTYKTLTEVEPRVAVNAANTPGDAANLFKITQPGSYYLTGNIAGVVGKNGIGIASSGVTLDLNGFELLGVAGSLDGVGTTASSLRNIAVVNGSVRNWGDEGVDLLSLAATNSRIDGVLASANTGIGISTGNGASVTNCAAHQNASNGINAGSGCTIANCTVYNNTNHGIFTNTACIVASCVAYNNTGTGINTGNANTISNCSAYGNASNGISTSTSCTVSHCSVYFNSESGIGTNQGTTIADCTVRSNTLDGIACVASCVIRGNTCSNNGNTGDGANIHTAGGDNRIEGNNCSGADRGIDVDASGNIIVRNTCSGNTINWVIAANNVVGPILDRTAPASAAISGNSAASSLGSTEPNANFTY